MILLLLMDGIHINKLEMLFVITVAIEYPDTSGHLRPVGTDQMLSQHWDVSYSGISQYSALIVKLMGDARSHYPIQNNKKPLSSGPDNLDTSTYLCLARWMRSIPHCSSSVKVP